MPVSVNISDNWKKTHKFVNVSDEWKPVINVWINISGIWKPSYTYSWEVGSWGACSVTCGGGTQTRVVRCLRNDGIYVDDQFCLEVADYTYEWETGNWSKCSKECGGGTQTRTVRCRRSDGTTVADSFCD